MNGKGRPTKLTPETIEDFAAAVSIGCTFDAAAVNAGIAYSTYRLWATEGEAARVKLAAGEKLTRHERALIDFLEAVEEAQATAKLNWQSTIDKAARIDPAWAWKMLQVRDSANYAPPPTRAEVSGPAGGAVKTEIIIRYADDASGTGDGDGSPPTSGPVATTP